MQHPFQCIAAVKRPDGDDLLLAACGQKLVSVCLETGQIASQWAPESPVTSAGENPNDGKPVKKQKTAAAPVALPNVIKLAVSPSNQYAVAVTDDKCVLVFDIDDDGKLVELSPRFMPKRPCAIQILPDNETILCGDKFGDVYSLPLHHEVPDVNSYTTPGAEVTESQQQPAPAFKPSATNLTVHTQRNRKALESQLKQRNLNPKTKEALKFEHKLLLGHVSMLTDVAYATREVDGKQRGYILTADRDEHIRISRAPPQTHVIEGYCLGHKEFVSKICVVPGTDLFVSGGGDDWIGVWKWSSFRLRRKIPIIGLTVDLYDKGNDGLTKVTTQSEGQKVAISGIWIANSSSSAEQFVIVASERRPALGFIAVSDLCREDVQMVVMPFKHPVIDLCCVGDSLLLSLDSRTGGDDRLEALRIPGHGSGQVDNESDSWVKHQLKRANAVDAEASSASSLDDLLYGVEKMRKRTHTGQDLDAEEET